MLNSPANTTQLEKLPNIKSLLLKAAFKRVPAGDRDLNAQVLPNTEFHIEQLNLNKSLIKPFHSVVYWNTQVEYIHPCYLHTLAFPLHLKLLLLPACPFPLLGLIHLSNNIKQLRPVITGENLTMTACFGRLSKHAKGWTFNINIEFYSESEMVWSSQSHYLSRTKNANAQAIERTRDKQIDCEQIKVTQHLSDNLGRQYAKVSGDFNPIHLTKLSAKLFGLKRHIIHGMWTKAFCLSQLQNYGLADLAKPFEVNVEFKQPLYLPSQISCSIQQQQTDPTNNHSAFKVQSVNQKRTYLHLVGTVKAI